MVVEHFKDYEGVYRRFAEKGRMLPVGLDYVSSWINSDKTKCFQLMETANPDLFEEWFANWNDLVNFEVFQVRSSTDVQQDLESENATI